MSLGLSLSTMVGAITTWLEADSSLTSAVYTGQHAPKIDYPYATINLISGPILSGGRRAEKLDYNATDDQIDITYYDQALMTFSLQFYSDDPSLHAMDLAFEALNSLQLLPTREALMSTAKLAYLSDGGIVNLDFVASNQLISRSGLTVTFNTVVSTSEQIDTIDSVTIEETLTDEAGTSLGTVVIEIP